MKITIGSRGSKLALWQAEWLKARLEASGERAQIKIIKTTGDKLTTAPLAASGTKGLFIKEIEEALLAGEVDAAIHSLKDLPVEQPAGLIVAAVPAREDPRDALVARAGRKLGELSDGARVGTGSLRRISQLRALRPGLEVMPVRGNVDTRLRKLDAGEFDALVLAAAGLRRLGLESRASQIFSVDEMCPAVGQGALAVEVRHADARVAAIVATLDDAGAHRAVRAERALLKHLGGGCQVPIAAHATARGGRLGLTSIVASLDGAKVVRATGDSALDDPEALGVQVAEDLLAQGARELLAVV